MNSSVKNQWLESIMTALFKHELQSIDNMIEHLNNLNCIEKKTVAHGFMYQGIRYVAPSANGVYKKHLPNLAFTLSNECAKFIARKNKLDVDMIHIRQLFIYMLAQCANSQEIRDTLPDCVAQLTPAKSLPRVMQDNTYLFKHDRFGLEEYERLLPKIQMYSVSNLLY